MAGGHDQPLRNIDGGLPIGLINYSHSGVLSFSTWRDEIGFNLLTLSSGSRSFFTSLTAGNAVLEGRERWVMGVGAGVQKRGRRFFLGLDLHACRISSYLEGDYTARIDFWPLDADFSLDPSTSDNYLSRLRLETGVVLAQPASFPGSPSLFGGVSLNQLLTNGHPRLFESGSRFEKEPEEGCSSGRGISSACATAAGRPGYLSGSRGSRRRLYEPRWIIPFLVSKGTAPRSRPSPNVSRKKEANHADPSDAVCVRAFFVCLWG